jgi:hypothetical protein
MRIWLVLTCVACTTPRGAPLGYQTPPPPQQQPTPIAVIPPDPPLPDHAAGTPVRVQIDFNRDGELTAAGFHENGKTSTFGSGLMTTTTEWIQEGRGFTITAGDPPGWTVEARLKLDAPCDRPGVGFWIHDGYHFVRIGITDHEIKELQSGLHADIGSTSGFRTYRIAVRGNALAISVDGKQVISGAALSNLATIALTFGMLGDGCPNNPSTWDWIAYETVPATPLAWPADWHPGTTAELLSAALGARAPQSVATDDVPCLALLAVDGAVHDLLPLGYDQLRGTTAAAQLRASPPAFDQLSFKSLHRQLADATRPEEEPICDPAPNSPCPPREEPPVPPSPAFMPTVLAALDRAENWADHPAFAYQATALAMQAYDQARAAKVPGADAAAQRLAHRLAALATHPRHCGL